MNQKLCELFYVFMSFVSVGIALNVLEYIMFISEKTHILITVKYIVSI